MVQWLRLHASNAGGMGSIPGQRTKIPDAVQYGEKKSDMKITWAKKDTQSKNLGEIRGKWGDVGQRVQSCSYAE